MPPSRQMRRTADERIAREKAQQTHVYISGLTGYHTLETGLAYYYRGHYIYAYPVGTLIEPVPYSTRKGILIQGILSDSAPVYDGKAAGLVEEESIRALTVSVLSSKAASDESDQAPAPACSNPDSSASDPLRSAPSPLPPPPPSRTPSGDQLRTLTRAFTSCSSLASLNTQLPSQTFTPQPGQDFLAASAPGSRLASRAVSPAGLRPTSSHIGLVRLQGRLSALQGLSYARGGEGGGGGGRAAGSRVVSASAYPNPNSFFHSRGGKEEGGEKKAEVGYLPGLGDHALGAERGEGAGAAAIAAKGGRKGDKEGRVKPCGIHGEGCDGFTTERVWKTEEARLGSGFVEEVPMVQAGGRQMVDWAGLMGEVRGL